MKRATIVGIACALLAAGFARADQGWQDNQDGSGFICYDVGTLQVNNLVGSGTRCARVDSTGKLIPASFDCVDPSTLAYQHWSDGTFSPLPQELLSTAGAGLSIADDPSDGATVISLPTVGTAGSCTNCSVTFDLFGRATTHSSGSGSGVSSVTGTAQRIAATPTTGAVVVDTIGGFYSGATSGGNQNLSLLSTGVAKINVVGTASFSIAAPGTDIAPVGSCASHQFATATNAASLTCAQPAFSDLSGSQSCAQKPAQTGDVTSPAGSCATTVASVACAALPAFTGAVGKPLASCVTTINAVPCGALPGFTGAVSNSGGGTCATTVNFSGLSGSAACSQLPAFTGDVTTTAGTCGTTLASVISPGPYGYIISETVDAKGRATAFSTSSTPISSTLSWQMNQTGISIGYNNTTLVFPAGGGNAIFLTSAGGTAVSTVLAANYGSSTSSPPTYPFRVAWNKVVCAVDVGASATSGSGSATLQFDLWGVVSNPATPANWTQLANTPGLSISGGATSFQTLGFTVNSVASLTSLTLLARRTDSNNLMTITSLAFQAVCTMGQ